MNKPGWVLLGIVIGVVGIGAVRFVAMPEEHHGVHYHANWAMFVNGQRVDMTGMRYMEDVGACSADPANQRPEDRVHMHEGNQDIVHVHASGATWDHLIANVGLAMDDNSIDLVEGHFENSGDGSLKFILDGSRISSLRNRPIGDQDRLLISYGPESVEEVIATQFEQVASNAGEYNTRPDPASCSGAEEESAGDRLRRAFLF